MQRLSNVKVETGTTEFGLYPNRTWRTENSMNIEIKTSGSMQGVPDYSPSEIASV
jgi:hypothetical protein